MSTSFAYSGVERIPGAGEELADTRLIDNVLIALLTSSP